MFRDLATQKYPMWDAWGEGVTTSPGFIHGPHAC